MFDGGIYVRYPRLMNLVVGAKILWNIVHGEVDWWKKILREKCLRGSGMCCLYLCMWEGSGWGIWDLCKVGGILIQYGLH